MTAINKSKIYRGYITVGLNRQLKEDEIISPGSYHFTKKDGTKIEFDFCETQRGYDDDGRPICIMTMEDLNTASFPKTSNWTLENFEEINKIDNIYLNLEDCKEDLKVIKILSFAVKFDCEDNFKYWDAPESLLEAYNKSTYGDAPEVLLKFYEFGK